MKTPVFAEDVFGENNTALADTLRAVTGSGNPRIMLVADMNVVQHTEGLGTKIGRYVKANGIELMASPVVLPGGEKVKCDALRCAFRVATAAVEAKIGANDCIVALGGGTILDVAGWAASQVRGGVKLVRIPTTIASMIEAGFAESAALDCAGVKDSLKVRCVPSAVVIDTRFALTVLDGVWRAGFSEAVRLATVADGGFLRRLSEIASGFKSRDDAAMVETVKGAIDARMKCGGSAFGLWSALRLEAMSGYKLPHGYAIAIGVTVDTAYAQLRGLITEEERSVVIRALEDCGAMDGALHSRHLVAQTDAVLRGLDGWRLSYGSEEVPVPNGLGRSIVEKIDRDTMKQALNMIK
jgi:3-dehydroquinate synthase